MSDSSPYPGLPYPLRPERGLLERFEPVVAPLVDVGGGVVRDSSAAQRGLLAGGPLDREAITCLAAQLMAFDGASSRDVEIIISSPGGPISDIFPAFDVSDLMRAKVNATAIGVIEAVAGRS